MDCDECDGEGVIENFHPKWWMDDDYSDDLEIGEYETKECPKCKGYGVIEQVGASPSE